MAHTGRTPRAPIPPRPPGPRFGTPTPPARRSDSTRPRRTGPTGIASRSTGSNSASGPSPSRRPTCFRRDAAHATSRKSTPSARRLAKALSPSAQRSSGAPFRAHPAHRLAYSNTVSGARGAPDANASATASSTCVGCRSVSRPSAPPDPVADRFHSQSSPNDQPRTLPCRPQPSRVTPQRQAHLREWRIATHTGPSTPTQGRRAGTRHLQPRRGEERPGTHPPLAELLRVADRRVAAHVVQSQGEGDSPRRGRARSRRCRSSGVWWAAASLTGTSRGLPPRKK